MGVHVLDVDVGELCEAAEPLGAPIVRAGMAEEDLPAAEGQLGVCDGTPVVREPEPLLEPNACPSQSIAAATSSYRRYGVTVCTSALLSIVLADCVSWP